MKFTPYINRLTRFLRISGRQGKKSAGRPRPPDSPPLRPRATRRTRLRHHIRRIPRRVRNFVARLLTPVIPESRGFWIILAVAVPAISAIGLSVAGVYSQDFQEWLIGNEDNREHGSTTIRNLGLIIAGLVALPLAIWRGIVADKQSAATHRQADTAQLGLRNERYQRGAEMLGNKELSIRLGGIYALQRLAEEDPERYHLQVMRLFCSFVRHPTRDSRHGAKTFEKFGLYGRRDDIEAVMRAIRERPTSSVDLEFSGPFHLDFQDAYLGNLYTDVLGYFSGSGSFIHANFSNARIPSAVFENLDFQNAIFAGADLSNTYFVRWTSLRGASLAGANLSGTEFSEVAGLTQVQLEQAFAYASNPPRFFDVPDADTGEPLEWTGGQGEPYEDEE